MDFFFRTKNIVLDQYIFLMSALYHIAAATAQTLHGEDKRYWRVAVSHRGALNGCSEPHQIDNIPRTRTAK